MASDSNCVFCKIAAGQIPALRVHEDDDCLAFLDIGPLAEGHLLIIPKEHYARLEEMPEGLVGRVTATLPRLARAVLAATGADGYNILQNNGKVSGQEVPHVHFHIIPRKAADGLGYRWNAGKYGAGRDQAMHKSVLEAIARG